MTENEAKAKLERTSVLRESATNTEIVEAVKLAIQALSEIQSYRAIGTVEEIKSIKENGAFSGVELAQIYAMQIRLREYQNIGTVEQFKALKEKEERFDRNIKMFNKIGVEIRSKAITEFSERMKEIYPFTILELEQLDEFAEEMKKAGAECD